MMKVSTLLFFLLTVTFVRNTWAFACKVDGETAVSNSGGSANVYVSLEPEIQDGENLVVDLSAHITCANTTNKNTIDYVSLSEGSAYSGALENFVGTVNYDGSSYSFPTTTETSSLTLKKNSGYIAWPTILYLTPVGTASGTVINAGDQIAKLVLHQTNSYGDSYNYDWNIFATNSTVVPTGGCDVSSRNVAVELPEYPGSARVPLTIYCAKNQNVSYYLTGTTVDAANTIFENSASDSAASGIGVQLMHNGSALPTGTSVSLGTVSTESVDLGLTATYARIGNSYSSGNVESLIGVTFTYN